MEHKIGRVISKQGLVGLENDSDTPWTILLPDGQSRVVGKGQSLPAKKNFKIRFGQNETGEIK